MPMTHPDRGSQLPAGTRTQPMSRFPIRPIIEINIPNRTASGSLAAPQSSNDSDNAPTKPSVSQPRPHAVTQQPRKLQASDPLVYVNDDPVFNTRDAARILGLTVDRMEKWRQRGQGPDYLRYDGNIIGYELSALIQYKAAHRVRPSRQHRPTMRSSR